MKKTLMERTRSTLSGSNLENNFWAKVVATTCYLINMSPTLDLVYNTPMDVYMGNNPSLHHLHNFYCEAYAHVPKEKQSKFDNKAVKYIFISYVVGVQWYKIWDLMVRKFLYSKNLTLREINPSPIVVQPKEDEKKSVVQLPPKTKKFELEN
jgi:hypothetical protein